MQISIDNDPHHSESGIALVLVAIAVLFLGVFMSLGLGMFKVPDAADYEQITRKRQALIVAQLASFAQDQNRMPCAADPAVSSTSPVFGLEARPLAAQDCTITVGIVPFQALGLTAHDAIDGWGHYFTYRPGAVFTNLDKIADSGISVYSDCTQRGIWVTEVVDSLTSTDDTKHPIGKPYTTTTSVNRNPHKAKFCCPNSGASGFGAFGQDIVMTNPNGIIPVADGFNVRTTSGVNNINAFQVALPGGTPSTWAFVLVSHGEDGAGAYTPGSSTTAPGGIGPELLNISSTTTGTGSDDRTYVDMPRVLVPGASYFDDIVVYMTQTKLYNSLNNGSCVRPFR